MNNRTLLQDTGGDYTSIKLDSAEIIAENLYQWRLNEWNEKYHAKFKKYSPGNQVWDKRTLEDTWKQVKANRGSAGINGVTIEGFEQNSQQNLAEIERQLKENRYFPQPVKRVLIPKDNGKMRQLGVLLTYDE